MSSIEIVKYVLLGVFGLAVLIGFLFGLGRGWAKAGLRFVFFALFAGIAVVITPYVSNLVLDIPINIGTLNGSVSEIMNNFVYSNETLASLFESSEVLQEFLNKLPVTIINLLVFVLLLFVLSGISWIVYAIFASVFGKKYKEPQKPKNLQVVKDQKTGAEVTALESQLHVDFKPQKPKKLRLVGGLVGAIHGIIFLALLLLPVTGFLSIADNLLMSTEGNIAYASTEEQTPTAQILDEYIPDEVKDYLQVYRESPIYYISKYTGADSFVFDTLTTVKVNANNENFYISYRSEIYSLAKVYDNVAFLRDIDFENIVFKDLDYDKLEIAKDTLLSSKLLKTLAPELLNWTVEEVNLPGNQRHLQMQIDEQYVNILNKVKAQYDANGGLYTGLTQDVNVVFNVFRAVGSSGIIDEALKQEVDVNEIISLALANNREVITQVAGNLFNAISLRTLMVDLINSQLDNLTLSQDIADRITFSDISLANVNWSNVSSDFLNIVNKVADIYVSLEDDFTVNIVDLISTNPYELLNADFDVITTKLGQIMTTIQNSGLLVDNLGQKVLYGQFMDYFNKTSIAQYVDFNEFKTPNVWTTEMTNLNDLLTALKDSGVASMIVDNIGSSNAMESINFNDLIDNLSTYATNNQTYISNIISPILDSVAFRKVLFIGFDYLNGLIEDNQEQLGTGVVLGKIQSEKILDENEKVNILSFFDNVVLYAHEIDFETAGTDLFTAIIESNLTRLGMALDSVKDSELFGPYEEEGIDYDGIYISLINALANNATFNQFADFDVALEEDFSWNSELSLVQSAIDEMNSIKIDYSGTEKTLIQAIMDNEDLSLIIETLTDDNVDNLVGPLVSSRLLGKNIVLLVNVMNDQIESILLVNVMNDQIESILGVTIADIPSNTVLTNQVSDITAIIKEVLAIYPDIKNGIGETEIQTLSQQLGHLLNTVKANALRTDVTGVFSGTYSAVINYFRNNATYGAKFAYIVDSYNDPADINWEDLLGLTVEVNGLTSSSAISDTLKTKLANILATMKQDAVYGDITEDIVEVVNIFINITNTSTDEDTLNYVQSALQILANGQNQYVLDNIGTESALKLEYSNKVNTVIAFFEGLTGIAQFDSIKNVTDYQAELTTATQIQSLLATANGGSVTVADIEDLIDALADSNLIISMLEDNDVNINLDSTFATQISNYIDTEFTGNQELIDTLKDIFNLA